MGRLVIVFFVFLLIGCSENETQKGDNLLLKVSPKKRKELMEGAFRNSAKKETEQIEAFFKRQSIVPKKTPTGVQYTVFEEGQGALPIGEDLVACKYLVMLLKGDTLYKSHDPFEDVRVEMDEKESGLHEALKLIPRGSKALIVIPSYRAHGLMGDSKKIPPMHTVVYQIELLNE